MGMFEFNLLVMLVMPILVTCVVKYLILFHFGGHVGLLHNDKSVKDGSHYVFLGTSITPLLMLVYWYFVVDKELVQSACFFYWLIETILSLSAYVLTNTLFTTKLIGMRIRHINQQKTYNVDFENVKVGQYMVRANINGDMWLRLYKCELESDASGTYKVFFNVNSTYKEARWTEKEITEYVRNYLLTSDTYLINIDGSLKPVTKKPQTITIC